MLNRMAALFALILCAIVALLYVGACASCILHTGDI
jgi:hypothetical protein